MTGRILCIRFAENRNPFAVPSLRPHYEFRGRRPAIRHSQGIYAKTRSLPHSWVRQTSNAVGRSSVSAALIPVLPPSLIPAVGCPFTVALHFVRLGQLLHRKRLNEAVPNRRGHQSVRADQRKEAPVPVRTLTSLHVPG